MRQCSGSDEDGRGRWGLRKRRAVGDGRRMVREAALMAALPQTWRGRVVMAMQGCWRRRVCMC